MNTLLVIGLIMFCTSIPIAYLQEDTAFMVYFNREPNSNIIVLLCRETASSTDISSASYFMNGTRINDLSPFITSSNGGLTFKIKRELEAIYSCGNESTRPLSNNRSLIGEYMIPIAKWLMIN